MWHSVIRVDLLLEEQLEQAEEQAEEQEQPMPAPTVILLLDVLRQLYRLNVIQPELWHRL
jgi:hypothetical protein